MNKKIKLLAEQANSQSKEVYEGDWPYNCAAWTGEELLDFAKLLIDDCAANLRANGYDNASECLLTYLEGE